MSKDSDKNAEDLVSQFMNQTGWGKSMKRVKELETQLRFCVGLISTMKQFEKWHPEEVLAWVTEQSTKLNVIP